MSIIYTGRHGAGRDRDYHAIKAWLDVNRLTVKQVALDADAHTSVVSQTIRGVVNSRKVLRYLAERGCPANILSLPADMKGASNGGR